MARSSYIYIVTHDWDAEVVLAAFTVKHELASWIKAGKFSPKLLRVVRIRDGIWPSDNEPVPLDPVTLKMITIKNPGQ